MIIVAMTSVLVISGVVYLARKQQPLFKICPICAGVSGTWLWILLGVYLGLLEIENWKLVIGMLMGGSIVGIAYQLEKRLPSEKRMAWKIFFIPAGLVMVHGLVELSLLKLTLSSVVIVILLYIFFGGLNIRKISSRSEKISAIEDKMKNCC